MQAVSAHLEDADFLGGAKAVLDGAQDPIGVVSIALKREHDIHHVLQHFGTGDGAFLGDVANEHDRQLQRLGGQDELGRGLPDLGDGPGRAFDTWRVQRLDGIDEEQVWLVRLDGLDDAFRGGLGKHKQFASERAEAICPEPHLLGAFLSGDVQHLAGRLHGSL